MRLKIWKYVKLEEFQAVNQMCYHLQDKILIFKPNHLKQMIFWDVKLEQKIMVISIQEKEEVTKIQILQVI